MTGRPFFGSRRQMDTLRFVRGYQEAHGGVSPSFNEIGVGLGSVSKSRVSFDFDRLERDGHIRRLPNRARAIEVLTDIPVPRDPDGSPLYFVRVP